MSLYISDEKILSSVHSQIQHLIHSLKTSPFSALLFKDDLFLLL